MSTTIHHDRDRTERLPLRAHLARLGTTMFFIACLLFLVVLVGWWLNWFDFRVVSDKAKDQVVFSLTVNKSAVADSAEELDEEAQKLSASAKTLTEVQSAEGRVVSYNQDRERLVIKNDDNEQVSFVIDGATDIRVDGEEASVNALKKGDKIAVVHRDKDEVKYALKVRRLADNR